MDKRTFRASSCEGLGARFADVAEEAQRELLAMPVRRLLPVVEACQQALAARLEVDRGVELDQPAQCAMEALVAEVAVDVGQPLRVVAQAVHLERDRAR